MLERSIATEPVVTSTAFSRGVSGRRPLGALLRRVARMSPVEIAHRLRERSRIYWERQRRVRDGGAGSDAAEALPLSDGSFLAYLRRGLDRRWLFNPTPEHRLAVRDRLAGEPSEREMRAEADALLAHEVELLGFGRVRLGSAIDWQRDPLTGARWPLQFWADYDLVNGGGPDPKVVHEVGRQGHLPRLGLAFYCLNDERCAREAVAQMLSWIDQNPIGWGVHWSSSLELALRVVAWITTLTLILPSRALDEAAACRIGASMLAQLTHVHRYLSRYTSPNTHLIGEAAALFLGGCFLPDARRSTRFRRDGARILEQEAVRQVGDDGVHRELSTYYHAYALDFFLLAYVMGERAHHPFSDRFRRRLAGMATFLAAVSGRDGRIPSLGDDDGGCAFTLAATHYHDIRPLLSSAARVLGRPELFHPAADTHALWLVGPGNRGDWGATDRPGEDLRAHVTTPLQTFANAGYFVETSRSGEHTARLLFDAGPMGLASGGHGHADALQVVLDVDDRPFLVDPGTFVYNRAPEWREYFRGTRAHNTITVDDRDQSEPGGTFGWGRKARVSSSPPVARSWCTYLAGEHDGYQRLASPVRHRRRVIGIASDYWLILDEVTGKGSHRAVWHYHLAPDVAADVVPSAEVTVALRNKTAAAALLVATSNANHSRVVEGETAPVQGWVSGRYGERTPAAVLEVVVSGPLPLLAVTVIRPWHATVDVEIERGDGFLIAKLPRPNGKDVVILNASGKTVATPEGSLTAGTLWLRQERGAVTHWLADDARGLSVGDMRPDHRLTARQVRTGRGYDID